MLHADNLIITSFVFKSVSTTLLQCSHIRLCVSGIAPANHLALFHCCVRRSGCVCAVSCLQEHHGELSVFMSELQCDSSVYKVLFGFRSRHLQFKSPWRHSCFCWLLLPSSVCLSPVQSCTHSPCSASRFSFHSVLFECNGSKSELE